MCCVTRGREGGKGERKGREEGGEGGRLGDGGREEGEGICNQHG